MTEYELYCMIFLALDEDWDSSHNQDLGQFLSSANPFLFKGIGSAVPDVYQEYLQFTQKFKITKENSFDIAKNYIEHVNIPAVTESFSTVKKSGWDAAMEEYLALQHVSEAKH